MKFPAAAILLSLILPAASLCQDVVKTGDEVFVEDDLPTIVGKKVGIITNQSGVLQDGRDIIDVLASVADSVVVFSPEHGLSGNASAGAPVNNGVRAGVRVYSLYGETLKPTPEMLKGIDLLLYDIQDVGARFYTYISTLDLTLEAAAENHIRYIVLDRPDMIRSDLIDGPVLEDSLRSFVGIQPIPSVYAMTAGELASMFNGEHMLKNGVQADLRVIRMQNYRRRMWYDETGLKWITPSPNLPDMNSIEVYPGDVVIEGTNLSEGRGTDHPFTSVGAPFINSQTLADLLNGQGLAGVEFEPTDFTPQSRPSAANPKYNRLLCHGVEIDVTDRDVLRPAEMGVTLVWAINKLYPDELKFNDADFDRLCGTKDVRLGILAGKTPEEIFEGWSKGLKRFQDTREKYLLY
ncbi:MAG TPA: DUF1343 domain-containing protein [Candidatus Acidoferrales bacterium]|nr:DUF1343 domain-containing protein [Candidatus Acidoferrales bacterium]